MCLYFIIYMYIMTNPKRFNHQIVLRDCLHNEIVLNIEIFNANT